MSSPDRKVSKKRKRVSVESESEEDTEYIRRVAFKYDNSIQWLPTKSQIDFRLLTNDESKVDDDKTNNELENGLESSNGGGGKGSNRTKSTKRKRRSKTTKEVVQPGREISTDSEFRFLQKSKENSYREPTDCTGVFNRYIDSIKEEEDLPVEYDMDEEDVMWLKKMNKRRDVERQLGVGNEIFEQLMDRFERESLFQQSDNQAPPIDEDAVCCICNDGECQNSNAIIFCDMCNLAVHQECYGVPYVPEGQWMCRRCIHSPSVGVDCVLCPNKGGAFKQTEVYDWAHVTCAVWIPEVCFGNSVFLEPIENISKINPQRWKLFCSICRQKNVGACIQCEQPSCYTAFHVTCAAQANLYMRIEAVKEGAKSLVRKVIYCPTHNPNKKNGVTYNGGIYSSGEEDSKLDNAKMQEARKLMDEKKAFVPIVSVPAIPLAKLRALSASLHFPRRNDFLLRLYAYWKLKRETRNGAPLIKITSSQNQHYKRERTNTSCPREASEIKEEINEAIAVRFGFETLRNLLELIKKREKVKQQLLKEDRSNVILKFFAFPQMLLTILDRVIEKDTNRIFLEPVSIEQAPDYFDHIKEPMDLGTMKTKAETFKYKSFQDFKDDLSRIVDNCLYYNDKETMYYKAALKLRQQIDSIIKDFIKFVDDFDPESGLLKALHQQIL